MSVHGSPPTALDSHQKHRLMEILDNIHAHDVIHGDVNENNILVDQDGTPFLIDFGFAEKNASREIQEEERNILMKCLESL